MSRSSTTTKASTKPARRIRPHPGEILREECLVPLGLSARHLAEILGVPHNRISDIAREKRSMTADTALRLARHFGTTAEFWLNLQSSHDLSKAAATTDFSRIPRRAA
jgi:antitoxin HigA-1